MPGRRVRANRPRPRLVPRASAAMERPGTPGHGAVRRIDRSAVAAATAEPTVPGAGLRLRLCARRNVWPACPAMGTRRPPRSGRVAGRSATGQAARCGRDLPHPALPAVAAGDVAVLPNPHQHLEGERASRRRRVRRPLPAEIPLASEMIRLDRLTPQLKLEMQYVLQRRHDDRQGKLTPDVVMRVVRGARRREGRLSARPRRGRLDRANSVDSSTTLAPAGSSATPAGRSPIWPRPAAGKPSTRAMSGGCADSATTATAPCGSTGIGQPWLRELAKRWVRWRLSTGLGLEAGGGRPVVVITRFARFLADIGIDRIDQIDRSVLERYLADLRGDLAFTPSVAAPTSGCSTGSSPRSANTAGTQPFPQTRCSSPRTTRNATNGCRGRWPNMSWPSSSTRTTLPASADPAHRLITIILMRCGLRVTDALRLRSRLCGRRRRGRPVSALLSTTR